MLGIDSDLLASAISGDDRAVADVLTRLRPVLGRSGGAVRVELHRARAMLRAATGYVRTG